MSTFVVSDLHGYSEVFERGLDHIHFSDSDSLYVIGDAIDRGPDGIKLLQMIHDNPNMDLLIGNHELLMLCSVDLDADAKCTGDRTELWLDYNGGTATFKKYCELSKNAREQLLHWLYERKLITQVEVNDKKFVLLHSFYDPRYQEASYSKIPKRDAWNIVWESLFRGDRYIVTQASYTKYSNLTFITGHVPVQRISPTEVFNGELPKPYRTANLINIDGGLAAGGNGLTNGAIFYKLDDDTYYVEPFERS